MNKITRYMHLYIKDWPEFRSFLIAIYRYIYRDFTKFLKLSFEIYFQILSPKKIFLRIRSRRYQILGDEEYKIGKLESAVHLWQQSNADRSKINGGALKPGSHVRILHSDYVQSIGHLGLVAHQIKMKKLGWISPETDFYILAPAGSAANRCLLNYWRGHASVIEDRAICRLLEPLSNFAQEPVSVVNTSGGESVFLNNIGAKVEGEWFRQARPALLTLTEEHRDRGYDVLKTLNGAPVIKFVAAHIRSRGFHDRNEQDNVRNSDIQTYLQTFRHIAERGYVIIRMGDPSMPPLPPMEGVIDYAHSTVRSDWMDIFLCAQAVFMIGTQSGPHMVSNLFGVQNVGINWAPTAVRPYSPMNIFIPKLLRNQATGILLPFSKQVSAPLGHIHGVDDLARHGIVAVDNLDTEIEDVTKEMLDRIDGCWKSEPEDLRLQERYDALCVAGGSYTGAPMGSKFLRKYQALLQ